MIDRRAWLGGGILRVLALGAVVLTAGCRYAARPANGTQRCAPGPKRCPDGYTCASDDRCWSHGTVPGGGVPMTDARPSDSPSNSGAVTGRSAAGLVPSGVHGRSVRFSATRAVVSPVRGGSITQRSPKYRFVGGLVGASTIENKEKR